MAPTAPPSLKPARLDADAAAYANRLAEDWRATGLAVGLDELPGGAGYVLTARSPSRTLSLRMPPLAAPRDTAGTRAGVDHRRRGRPCGR